MCSDLVVEQIHLKIAVGSNRRTVRNDPELSRELSGKALALSGCVPRHIEGKSSTAAWRSRRMLESFLTKEGG